MQRTKSLGIPVPSFFLYGETPREAGHHFLHLETLDARSRPANWNIRPHAHADLNHVLAISAGSGSMRTESGAFEFDGAALLIMPARMIHSFSFAPETAGRILTLSHAYLAELIGRERQFGALFSTPDYLALDQSPDEAARIADCLHGLARELAWTAQAHEIAVEAQLLTLLVMILRIANRGKSPDRARPGPQAELVARYREVVEEDFRVAHRIEHYAARLRISAPRLRAACQKAARTSPLKILNERVLLEAKRMLLYSNVTVSELAYSLGFDDPAYFSRVFRQHAGLPPHAFRARHHSA